MNFRILTLAGLLTSFTMTGESLLSAAELYVRGARVHAMDGPVIERGMVHIVDGIIEAVGPEAEFDPDDGAHVIEAEVVTPGLIDAHTVIGLSGVLNQAHDQDQLEASSPIQPELRALDAYNARDPLVAWVRQFGVTTLHTGHGPGALVSGQTMIVKTDQTVVDAAGMLQPFAMVAGVLGEGAVVEGGKSPGTRAKAMALLRAELIKAREYLAKREDAEPDKQPARDLRLETLGHVLRGEKPLLVTVHRHLDILNAIRLGREFEIPIVLDGAADAHLLLDAIRESGHPVIVHPPMMRAAGETENLTFEMPALLAAADIPFALQSGYERYVPKTRVVLFEAAVAAAYGLDRERALGAITIDAARLLKVDDRVGSLTVGKDADLALFDGDPFEYTTRCLGVVINGVAFDGEPGPDEER